MAPSSQSRKANVWQHHDPRPRTLVGGDNLNWQVAFQEVQYGQRGSWDINSPLLHIAALVTPARHRYGDLTNPYHAIAPSSAVALPEQQVIGGWEGPMVGRHLFITGAQYERMMGETLQRHKIQPYSFAPEADKSDEADIPAQLLSILAQDARNGSPGGFVFAESVVSALLQYLVGERSKSWGFGGDYPINGNRIANATIDFIQAHLSGRIVLSDIATEVGVSVQYLCRVFKRSTGMSPHQYLLRERVKRSRELILESQLPLAEIALECGFTDQSQMSTTFKNVLGISPSQLRD